MLTRILNLFGVLLVLSSSLLGCGESQHSGSSEYGKVEVLSYDIHLQLMLDDDALFARAGLKLRSQEKRISFLQFELHDNLRLISVEIDSLHVNFSIQGSTVKVYCGDIVPGNNVFSLAFRYSGRAFFDPELQEGDILLLSPRLKWYPIPLHIQGLWGRSSLSVRVPSGWKAVSNGTLTSESVDQKTTTYIWSSMAPTYQRLVVVGKYKSIVSDRDPGIRCYYQSLEDSTKLRDWTEEIRDVLQYYSTLFGSYPFGGLSVVEGPAWMYSGFAVPSMVVFNPSFFRRDKMYTFGVAHEIAHQWWGGMFRTRGDWANWLSEGFANYSACLYMEHKEGIKGRNLELEFLRMKYIKAAQRTSETNDERAQNAFHKSIVYDRGAWILHMLRYVLGDESFFRALREFLGQYLFRDVSAADFQRVCEEIHGDSLAWFFDEWVRGQGILHLTLDDADVSWVDTTYIVRADVSQTGNAIFTMPIDIFLHTESGDNIKRKAMMNSLTLNVQFLTKCRPISIEVDRDRWLLKFYPFGRTSGPMWDAFSQDKEDSILIVYGTRGGDPEEVQMNKAAALLMQSKLEAAYEVPIPMSMDRRVSENELRSHNLLLFGRPQSNEIVATFADSLPIRLSASSIFYQGREYKGDTIGLMMAAANPSNVEKYIFIKAGLTGEGVTTPVSTENTDYLIFDVHNNNIIEKGNFEDTRIIHYFTRFEKGGARHASE